jgi:hypothetical protein
MVYENWRSAHRCQSPIGPMHEYELFSDAVLRGVWSPPGCPYQVISLLERTSTDLWSPAALLRATYWGLPWGLPGFDDDTTAHEEFYHSGTLLDEFAALVSLSLGIRLQVSDSAVRRFEKGGDPYGVPIAGSERMQVPKSQRRGTMLPRAAGQRAIGRIAFLEMLPRIDPINANVLVVAARLYQEALWIAEVEPQRAWLLLISAAETVAGRWSSGSVSAIERLRTSRPALEQILVAAGGADLLNSVADQVAIYMGATAKFRDFLLAFLPAPPIQRGPEKLQIEWGRKQLKRSFERIYGYRSRALHGGSSFPLPLCTPLDGFEETPKSSAVVSGRHVWKSSQVPMLLHVFEFIVRGALLAWWELLTPPEIEV